MKINVEFSSIEEFDAFRGVEAVNELTTEEPAAAPEPVKAPEPVVAPEPAPAPEPVKTEEVSMSEVQKFCMELMNKGPQYQQKLMLALQDFGVGALPQLSKDKLPAFYAAVKKIVEE